MKVTTQFEFSDAKIVKTLGLVSGNAAYTRHIGSHFLASLREIIGGEVKEYTELLMETRSVALQRLKYEALELGADAIVGLHFSSSNIVPGMIEILAYGTAVQLR